MSSAELNSLAELILRETCCMAEDKAACIGDLVVEEFAEVLLIHLALLGVNNGGEAVELNVVSVDVLYRADDVAELADARGLDEDAVGVVLVEHLHERLAEVADERAADAARIHLGYLDAGVLQEAAVNAYLTELVLDKHELFAMVALSYQLLDERGLTGSEKAGENGYLSHY